MDFVDKNFSLTEYLKYRLSIQISLNGFSFCIFDLDKKKHVMIKSYNYSQVITDYNCLVNEVGEIVGKIPIFKIPVKCLFISPKNVYLPEAVFAENKLRTYISFPFRLEELDELHYKQIPEIKGYCGFAIPSPVALELRKHFEDISFFNQSYQSFYETKVKREETKLRIVFFSNFIDVTLFKNNDFVLNNTFEVSNIRDTLYFVSALINKFDIDNEIPIYVSGGILSSEIKEMKNFFPNIFQDHNKRISLMLGYDISSQYYNLLSLHECE